MTLDVPRRSGTLRRFIAVIATICRNMLIAKRSRRFSCASTPGQGVDDVERLHAAHREQRAHDRHRHRNAAAERNHAPGQRQTARADQAIDPAAISRRRCARPTAAPRPQSRSASPNDEAHDRAVAESIGLQHRELRNARANGLHHRYCRQEQLREQYCRDDAVDEERHVADLVDPTTQPIALVLRLRLERRVCEQVVDALGDLPRRYRDRRCARSTA